MSLSGGSAFGLASIGALSVLECTGFKPDCVGGNSMGAIIAGVYALGYPVAELEEMARSIRLHKMVRVQGDMLTQGLHGGWLRPDLAKILKPILGDACIGDCQIPFVCTAGRVKKPVPWHRIVRPSFTKIFLDCIEPYIFPPETKLLDAMLASSAIPALFAPVHIGQNSFIDLCNFGAIPAPTLRQVCKPDVVISTDTTSDMYAWMWPALPKGWRAFIAAGQDKVKEDLKSSDVIITPSLQGNQFRFDKSMDFIASGKAATEQELPRIQALLTR